MVGARRDAVELESEHAFHQWASERWPRAVFTVQLDAGSGPIRFRRNLST
jgi:hypothetical protein